MNKIWQEPQKYIDRKYSCIPAQDRYQFDNFFKVVIEKHNMGDDIIYEIDYSSPTIRSIIEDTLPTKSYQAILGLKPADGDGNLEEKVLTWTNPSDYCTHTKKMETMGPSTLFLVEATPYTRHVHEFVKYAQSRGYEIAQEWFLIANRSEGYSYGGDSYVSVDAFLDANEDKIDLRIGWTFSFNNSAKARKWHNWAWNLAQKVILPEYVKTKAKND